MLTDSIEYRLAQREDAEAIREHFNRAFQQERSADESAWKFGSKPWNPEAPLGVVALKSRRVVGFYGSLSWQLVVNGHVIGVAQPCDVSVDQRLRGCGICPKLFARFSSCRSAFGRFGFGFPNDRHLRFGLLKLGYTIQCGTVHLVRAPAPWNGPRGKVTHSTTLPDNWSPFCCAQTQRLGITSHRSPEFLRWRYRSFPGREFNFLTCGTEVGDTNPSGILAYQLTPGAVRVYDWLAPDPRDFRALFTRLAELYPTVPIFHGCTDTAPYLDELSDMGFTTLDAGSLVTVQLTEFGTPVHDDLVQTARASDRWFATFTDTDL